jgi:hypothetical protein
MRGIRIDGKAEEKLVPDRYNFDLQNLDPSEVVLAVQIDGGVGFVTAGNYDFRGLRGLTAKTNDDEPLVFVVSA